MTKGRAILIWTGVIFGLTFPLAASLTSPLLAWRDPIYIAGGIAGILGLSFLLVQPLLATGRLPGLTLRGSRRLHRWVGGGVVVAVLIHVIALWITSPPDVVDALLFVSPTPFSAWGVIAMWAVFATGAMAVFRRRLRLPPTRWRTLHLSLTLLIVLGSVVHSVQIEGTMETLSKFALCGLVVAATINLFYDLKRRRASGGQRGRQGGS